MIINVRENRQEESRVDNQEWTIKEESRVGNQEWTIKEESRVDNQGGIKRGQSSDSSLIIHS
jgi:hypothetical protein